VIPFVQGLKGLTEGFMVRTFLYCDHGSTQVNGSYMEKMEVGGGPEYSDDTMHTSRKDLCIRGMMSHSVLWCLLRECVV